MGSILEVFNLKAAILLVIHTLEDLVVFIQNFIYMQITEQFQSMLFSLRKSFFQVIVGAKLSLKKFKILKQTQINCLNLRLTFIDMK